MPFGPEFTADGQISDCKMEDVTGKGNRREAGGNRKISACTANAAMKRFCSPLFSKNNKSKATIIK
jgi:hypothetical protein